jgi:hypothetical protein
MQRLRQVRVMPEQRCGMVSAGLDLHGILTYAKIILCGSPMRISKPEACHEYLYHREKLSR